MAAPLDYHQKVKRENVTKLREKLTTLPSFLKEYFRAADDAASRTKLAYAGDFGLFFNFLTQQVPRFMSIEVTEFSLENLADVTPEDIDDFLEYVTYYVIGRETKFLGKIDRTEENESAGKLRKLSSLRAMFTYFYQRKKIPEIPTEFVRSPKLHEKPIIKLDPNEVSRLLDLAEDGSKLSAGQKRFHDVTKKRDVAILTLLLGTGMRVSECVGLDMTHVDFEEGALKVARKGGKEAILYFGAEVSDALADYLDEREFVEAAEGDENALFLSVQKTRMSVRAIQNLVKKYAAIATPLKKITPHKLRSTFGTNLYNETGDIYLVASMLGHSSVDTTRKHYASMDENRMRNAANGVVLRDKT